ncbi:MAG: GNAT family N-acetyltransferase [Cyanobacteria bacterium P01_F01_bin.53]
MVAQFEERLFSVKPQKTLTVDQQKAAATILGQAFAQDSFMAYVLPDAETRVQQLTKLFLPLIRCSQYHGSVNITPGGGGILAWVPGKAFSGPIKFLELFRSRMLSVPLRLGLTAFRRFQAHDNVCEEALLRYASKGSASEDLTSKDFAYIWAVGVRPDQKGKGLGKKMIGAALEEMRQQGYATCWLRTENPKNVGFYEHLGFQQVHTEIPAGSGQRYWLMFQNL